MKIILSIAAIFAFLISCNAQTKTISKEEYDKAFEFAVSETNNIYPHIFEVVTEYIKDGKTVRKVTEVSENEAQLYHRIKNTTFENGKETIKYQVNVGSGNVFCSEDGVTWKQSKYECGGSFAIYGPREPETTEYSVSEKKMNGKKVSIYRAYSVFAPSKEGGKRTFDEKISTIDSKGLFITIEGSEGTLDPKTVTLTRKQTWTLKAKIAPVVSPIK